MFVTAEQVVTNNTYEIQAVRNLSSEFFFLPDILSRLWKLIVTRLCFSVLKRMWYKFFSQTKSILFLYVTLCHFQNKKLKAGSMNKMKKKTNIRVAYIQDYKIQFLIKENICNLQEIIVPLFLETTTDSERYFNKLPCIYYSLFGNAF